MIDLRELVPDDVGRGVVYTPSVGAREDGVVVRWNDSFIFVRYAGSETPKATSPTDLDWLRGAS